MLLVVKQSPNRAFKTWYESRSTRMYDWASVKVFATDGYTTVAEKGFWDSDWPEEIRRSGWTVVSRATWAVVEYAKGGKEPIRILWTKRDPSEIAF